MVDQHQLEKLYSSTNPYIIAKYLDPLNATLTVYEINTPERIAMFFAQIGHESGGLRIVEENLNYSAERLLQVFPSHFTEDEAHEYAHQSIKIGNRVYANRIGNGDEASGDGYKFHGRGFIQLTGRANYQRFAETVNSNADDVVDYVASPEGACDSAGWFWKTNNLNQYADAKDVLGATKRINGGTNGLAERQQLYNLATQIFA